MSKGIVFLDRDGTINVEKHYLHRVEDLEIIDGVCEAIRLLKDHGFLVISISNQSGIGRGYYREEDAIRVNNAINGFLEKECNTHIDAFYFCPHTPEDNCNCRKPKTGLIELAYRDLGITKPHTCFFVGDKLIDVQTGHNAGCKGILVLTGYGKEEKDRINDVGIVPDFVAKDLLDAVKGYILKLK